MILELRPPDDSGSYTIAELNCGANIVLARSQSWAGDKPALDEIEFVVIPDEKVAGGQCDRGEIDAMMVTRDLSARCGGSDWRVSSATTGRIVYLVLFPKSEALRSPDVRRGVQLSLDQNALVETVYSRAGARAAHSFAPAGWPWAGAEAQIAGSHADAADLLRASQGAKLSMAVASFPTDPTMLLEVAKFVANSLAEFNIGVEFVLIEPFRLVEAAATILPKFDMLLTNASVWSLGVRDTLARFSSIHAIGSERIDELNRQAETEPTVELLRDIENQLFETGAARVLVEELAVWTYRETVTPFFGPDGAVANLGAWSEG